MSQTKAQLIEGLNINTSAPADALVIDSSGNVGIGSSPHSNSGTNLHIHGSNTTAELRLTNTTTGTGANGGVIQQGGNTLYITNSEAGNIAFENNGAERMRINSSGRLLLGTTTEGEGSADNFTVADSGNSGITIRSGTSDRGSIYFSDGTSGSDEFRGYLIYDQGVNAMRFGTDATERMRIDSSGNVGIGTTSPSSRLHLVGTDTAYSGNVAVGPIATLADTAGRTVQIVAPGSVGEGGIGTSTNHDFTLFTSNTEKVRLTQAGNVGIGTSSPTSYGNSQATLVIEDDTNPAICWSDTGQTRDWWAVANGSNLSFNYADGGGSGSASNVTNALSMTDSGNVGIGTTSPDGTLHVHSASAGSVTASGSADDLVVENSGDTGISILAADGNNTSCLFFGNATDAVGATVRWTHDNNQMQIGPDKSGAHLRFNSGDGVEAARIDSAGRLLVGTSTSSGFSSARLIVNSAGSSSTDAGNLVLQRGEANSAISSGDAIGNLSFADESGYTYANISADADATPGSDSPGRLVFATTADGASSSTERMRINSSGVVQIQQTGVNTLRVQNSTSSGANMLFQNSTTGLGAGNGFFLGIGDNEVSYVWNYHNEALIFATNNTERMRVDTSGTFMVGQTNGSSGTVGIVCNANGLLTNCTSNVTAQVTNINNLSGTKILHLFRSDGTNRGSIETNGSSVSYNTTSDYRLKENVVDIDGAIDRVKQLLPKRFNFISHPERTVDGFLAHEAQAVVPEAVTGTHNGVEVWEEGEELPDGVSVGDNKLDDDGNTIPDYQGIDQSKLVPLLTAALQEAIAKIETLETQNADLLARVTALEAG